jgi:sugar lactone lactonase YvrE
MRRNNAGIAALPNHLNRMSGPVIAAHEAVSNRRSKCASASIAPSRSNRRRLPAWLLVLAVLLPAAATVQAQDVFPPQDVGSMSLWQTITVTAQAAGLVNRVEVLTLGVNGLDFEPGGGASTCPAATLTAGSTCTQSVVFTPTAPGTRLGAVVLLDTTNKVLGVAYVSGAGVGPLGVFVPGNVITVAGEYRTWTSTQDGIPATSANLDQPSSVALDGAGNLYIADSAHNRIRKVSATTGQISTVAGIGAPAYTGDNGLATKATLDTPSGVALDGAGNIYIADTANNAIRMITAADGIITTVAGNGTAGYAGDKGPATSANLNGPLGISVDIGGNLFIADTANQRIRRVDASNGFITTVAGDGFESAGGFGGYTGDNGPATQAELNLPYAVAFDIAGNMYVPDSANNRVRKIDTKGTITTYAGNGQPGDMGDDGPAISAELHLPSGVTVDPAGNLYIADTQNSAIRKVSSASPNNISTIAQSGDGITLAPGGKVPGPVVLYAPTGMTIDPKGNLFVADFYYMLIQQVQSNLAILSVATPTRQGQTSAPQNQIVENDGNSPFDLTSIAPDKNAAVDGADTTCNLGTPYLAVNEDCVIAAEFKPSSAADPLFGNVKILGDTVDSPLDIELLGDATAINSTSVTLVSSHNPSSFGQQVLFTATISTGTGTPTGSVSYFDGARLLTVIDLGAAPVTIYPNSTLAVGSHSITASYSGDASHHASTSTALIQVVDEATATALASSLNPSNVGQKVTFVATVTAPSGGGVVPDGTVTFSDGAKALGTSPLGAGGTASYSTAALTEGLHPITATYSGDLNNNLLSSVSETLNQDVQSPSTTELTSAPNPSVHGTPVVFTATVKPSGNIAPTGTVNFLDAGKVVGSATLAGDTATFTTAGLSAGSHIVTAEYLGSTDDAASTSPPITQVVTLAQTGTTLVGAPNPGIAGEPIALTATVEVTAGTVATPTGNVTFTEGSITIGAVPIDATGTASINVTFSAGNHSIVATYAGDTNNDGSHSAPLLVVIQLAATSLAVTATPSPAIIDSPITFSAIVTGSGVTPTGSVTFLADGKSIGKGALNASGLATLIYSGLTVGTHSITAEYAGDIDNSSSTSPAVAEVVQAIPTVTDLGTSSSGAQVTLVASVFGAFGPTPTGTVSFKSGASVIGTATLNSTGVATLSPQLAKGSYTIVAVYGGDALHSPSTSQPVTVSGTASAFSLTVAPSTLTIPTKQNATVTITITSVSGFSDMIGLGCGSLPAAITCHFSSFDVNLAANGTQKVQLTIDTNNPLSGGASTSSNAHPGIPGTALSGIFLPTGAFFGFVLWRFRRRHAGLLTAALVLALSGAAFLVTGCGGFTQISATPGKYVIQVTGVGANSAVTRYQNVTLNITQ